MQIILSSTNDKKIKEFQEILSAFEVQSYKDFLDEIEIIEDGKSFEENARLKTEKIYGLLKEKIDGNFLVLSDDSGLCVDALRGMPEIYSARFASIDSGVKDLMARNFSLPTRSGTDEHNNLKLLACLKELGLRESRAFFVCVIAVCGKIRGVEIDQIFRGECEGRVIEAPLNLEAFGYDPLFVPRGYEITMDKIKEKNRISHRFKALQKFQAFLKAKILEC